MYKEMELDHTGLELDLPVEETKRQYFYMAVCRKWVENFEKLNHRLPKACVVNMGCQMNARDSEKLAGILAQAGFEEEEKEEQADFVIFNTCTVRENANMRVYGHLGQLSPVKKKRPHMKIALCGCMMQEPEVVEKLKKSYRFVDLIFGTHNIYKFAELLAACLESDRMIIDVWKDTAW